MSFKGFCLALRDTNVRSLSLMNDSLSMEHLRILMQADLPLEKLTLGGVTLGSAATLSPMPTLTALDLGGSSFTDEGAAVIGGILASAPSLRTAILDHTGPRMSPTWVPNLLPAESLARLETLNLEACLLHDEDLQYLASRIVDVRSVSLVANVFSSASFSMLLSHFTQDSKIRSLRLSEVPAESCGDLVNMLKRTPLESLSLGIMVPQVLSSLLGPALPETALLRLDVSGLRIPPHTRAFAEGLAKSKIFAISLSRTALSDDDLEILAEVLQDRGPLRRLDLSRNPFGCVEPLVILAPRLSGLGLKWCDGIDIEGWKKLSDIQADTLIDTQLDNYYQKRICFQNQKRVEEGQTLVVQIWGTLTYPDATLTCRTASGRKLGSLQWPSNGPVGDLPDVVQALIRQNGHEHLLDDLILPELEFPRGQILAPLGELPTRLSKIVKVVFMPAARLLEADRSLADHLV